MEGEGEQLFFIKTGFHVGESVGSGELGVFLDSLFPTAATKSSNPVQISVNTRKKVTLMSALKDKRIVHLEPPPARPRR